MPRVSMHLLLLACAVLPASATAALGALDAIEIVDFYARGTAVLPSGQTQPNAEIRAGKVVAGAITLHLRMKRHGGATQSVEWRMYRFPETANAFDTGVHSVAIQPDGDAMAGAAAQIQVGAYEIRAIADPNNRFREAKRALANNRRGILLIVVPPQAPAN